MDNDFFLNSGIEPELHFELSSDCFFNPNLENSIEQFSQFDSALSSMVSSPVSASNSAVSNENLQIRELIGKLGTIRNSGDIPGLAAYPGSTNASCYTTPTNSPPNLNYPTDQFVKSKFPNLGNSFPTYPPVQADPGFAERAAKFSCFGSRSFNGRTGQLGENNGSEFGNYRMSPLMGNSVKLTRVLSSPSLNVCGSQMGIQENKNLGQNQVEIRPNQGSPVSAQIPDSRSKKRKAVSKGKTKEPKAAEEDKNSNSNSKRHKDIKGGGSENGSGKTEVEKQGNGNTNGFENEEANAKIKPPELPKDYIHVRARRGQATDSHSLAERVRREKISERMKLLQDLVPGCNKVTGKALMLDEIINYVQSLQRQVEFLSMKLTTVNPTLDFNMDNLLPNNVMQPNGSMGHQMDTSVSAFFGHRTQKLTQIHNNNITDGATMANPLHTIFRHNIGLQSSQLDEFARGITQFQTLCEDDLQGIVQMGLDPNSRLNAQGLPGSNQDSQMTVGCEK